MSAAVKVPTHHVAAIGRMRAIKNTIPVSADIVERRIAELEAADENLREEERAADAAHASALKALVEKADGDAKAAGIRWGEKAERYERDAKADLARLRAETNQKDAKIKEIQTKFSFVLETVTEKIEIK